MVGWGVMNIEILKGKILRKIIRNGDEELIFEVSDDESYRMLHDQDCCESVIIEDICGELDWLIGEPILKAEERTSDEAPDIRDREYDSSETWTFYELATIKGNVTIRWYGTSNGYYSMSVDFNRIV